jgi:hypothetical protein
MNFQNYTQRKTMAAVIPPRVKGLGRCRFSEQEDQCLKRTNIPTKSSTNERSLSSPVWPVGGLLLNRFTYNKCVTRVHYLKHHRARLFFVAYDSRIRINKSKMICQAKTYDNTPRAHVTWGSILRGTRRVRNELVHGHPLPIGLLLYPNAQTMFDV